MRGPLICFGKPSGQRSQVHTPWIRTARPGAEVVCVARPAPGPSWRPRGGAREVQERGYGDSALRPRRNRCPASAGSRHLPPAGQVLGPFGVEGTRTLTGRLFRSSAMLSQR